LGYLLKCTLHYLDFCVISKIIICPDCRALWKKEEMSVSTAIGNIEGCSKQGKKMKRKKKVNISILLTSYSYGRLAKYTAKQTLQSVW